MIDIILNEKNTKTKQLFVFYLVVGVRRSRRILDTLLYYVGVGRLATVLHGARTWAIPSVRLSDHLEKNMPSFERYVMHTICFARIYLRLCLFVLRFVGSHKENADSSSALRERMFSRLSDGLPHQVEM